MVRPQLCCASLLLLIWGQVCPSTASPSWLSSFRNGVKNRRLHFQADGGRDLATALYREVTDVIDAGTGLNNANPDLGVAKAIHDAVTAAHPDLAVGVAAWGEYIGSEYQGASTLAACTTTSPNACSPISDEKVKAGGAVHMLRYPVRNKLSRSWSVLWTDKQSSTILDPTGLTEQIKAEATSCATAGDGEHIDLQILSDCIKGKIDARAVLCFEGGQVDVGEQYDTGMVIEVSLDIDYEGKKETVLIRILPALSAYAPPPATVTSPPDVSALPAAPEAQRPFTADDYKVEGCDLITPPQGVCSACGLVGGNPKCYACGPCHKPEPVDGECVEDKAFCIDPTDPQPDPNPDPNTDPQPGLTPPPEQGVGNTPPQGCDAMYPPHPCSTCYIEEVTRLPRCIACGFCYELNPVDGTCVYNEHECLNSKPNEIEAPSNGETTPVPEATGQPALPDAGNTNPEYPSPQSPQVPDPVGKGCDIFDQDTNPCGLCEVEDNVAKCIICPTGYNPKPVDNACVPATGPPAPTGFAAPEAGSNGQVISPPGPVDPSAPGSKGEMGAMPPMNIASFAAASPGMNLNAETADAPEKAPDTSPPNTSPPDGKPDDSSAEAASGPSSHKQEHEISVPKEALANFAHQAAPAPSPNTA